MRAVSVATKVSVAAGVLALTVVALMFGWANSNQSSAQGQASLSVFAPHAGGCGWYLTDLDSGDEQLVGKFPAECPTVQVAWSLHADKAVVWFTPAGYPSQEDMLFWVDPSTATVRRLPLPAPGEGQTYLIDEEGNLLAFSEDQQINLVEPPVELPIAPPIVPSTAPVAPNNFLEYAGEHYPVHAYPEGQDILVHAFTYDFKANAWRLTATTASRCCVDGAPGIAALSAYQTLRDNPRLSSRRSSKLLNFNAESSLAVSDLTPTVITDAQLLAKLNSNATDTKVTDTSRTARGTTHPPPVWLRLQQSDWPQALLVQSTSGVPSRFSARIFFDNAPDLGKLPGFRFHQRDVLQIAARGKFVLMTDWATGTTPQVYNLRTKQLVYTSNVANAVTFWPKGLKY